VWATMNYKIDLDIHIESAVDAYRTARERELLKLDGGQRKLDLSGQIAGAVLWTLRISPR
jgi:hypothetical protein